MNTNNYRKSACASLWFGDKIMLSKVLKKCHHQGLWNSPGGKVEKDEDIFDAVCREVCEETGCRLDKSMLGLVDCYLYPQRKLKVFFFTTTFNEDMFQHIKNTEPDKQSDWQLFTVKQALKLELLPSLRYYLKNL